MDSWLISLVFWSSESKNAALGRAIGTNGAPLNGVFPLVSGKIKISGFQSHFTRKIHRSSDRNESNSGMKLEQAGNSLNQWPYGDVSTLSGVFLPLLLQQEWLAFQTIRQESHWSIKQEFLHPVYQTRPTLSAVFVEKKQIQNSFASMILLESVF